MPQLKLCTFNYVFECVSACVHMCVHVNACVCMFVLAYHVYIDIHKYTQVYTVAASKGTLSVSHTSAELLSSFTTVGSLNGKPLKCSLK